MIYLGKNLFEELINLLVLCATVEAVIVLMLWLRILYLEVKGGKKIKIWRNEVSKL
jgi:hypothetical protein